MDEDKLLMTEQELQEIEKEINGEDRPDDIWFIDTIQGLVDEVRKLRASQPVVHVQMPGYTISEFD